MSADPPKDTKKSLAARLLRPKVAIPLFLVFLILVSPLVIRGWFLRGVPNAPEPFDAQPLLDYSVPDDENAFNDYRMATSLYIQPTPELSQLRDRISEQGWQLANDEVRQFLHDNEDALLAWKEGTQKDLALYIPAEDYEITTLLEVVQNMRELHRTAILICKQLEAEGHYPQEAWYWYRAAVRASRHTGTHGCFIERLVGMALFQETASHLESWAAHPELSGDDLRKAIDQLQTDWQLTEKPSTALQIEYLTLEHTLENISGELASELGANSPMLNPKLMYFIGEPELSRRVARVYFRNQLEFCDLHLYQRPSTVGLMDLYDDPRAFKLSDGDTWDAEKFEAALSRATLARWLLPATASVTHAFDREAARYRTLLVTLAGQAFRRDHGHFPKTLGELVPDYLDEIPLDNFDGKPLKYRFDPAGPVVYSVFQNLTDDGGLEWSHDSLPPGKNEPDDLGYQMRLPEAEPLPAPKPSPP